MIFIDLERPKETFSFSALAEKSAAISLDLSLSSSPSSSDPIALAIAMANSGFNYMREERHGRLGYKGVGKSIFSYPGIRLNKQYVRARGISEQIRSYNSSTIFNKSFIESTPYSEEGCESLVFRCNFCGRKFHNAQALGGHQNAHKQERDSERIAHRNQVVVTQGSSNMSGSSTNTNTSTTTADVSMLSSACSDKAISQSVPGSYSLAEKNRHSSSATNLRQSHVGNWTPSPKYSFHFNAHKEEKNLKFNGYMTSDDTWPGNLKYPKETTSCCAQNLKRHTNLSAEETSGNASLVPKAIRKSEKISVLDLSLRL